MQELQLSRRAAADVADGQIFYEEQSPGLGLHFRKAINSDLLSLLSTAGVHRKVDGFHRYLSERFPFAIFYKLRNNTVRVYAVLDCRRRPAAIRRELRGR